MASNSIPVPAPMQTSGNASENWTFFKEQWTNYEIATELDQKDQKIRIATLKTVMGKECFQKLKQITLSDDESKNITSIIDKLEEKFSPEKNPNFERYMLFNTKQKDDETVDNFVTRLNSQASVCNLAPLKDSLTLTAMCIGLKDNSTKLEIFKDPKLDLAGGVKVALTMERALKEATCMSGTPSESLNMVKQNPNRGTGTRPKTPRKCKFCATTHVWSKELCPAYGRKCKSCGKPNHTQESYLCKGSTNRKVNTAERGSDSDSSCLTVTHYLANMQKPGKKYHVTITVNGQHIRCQVDCGATCDIMSYQTYRQLNLGPLQPTSIRLKLYDGSYMLPEGVNRAEWKYNDKIFTKPFQVVQSTQQPLLSGSTCEEMGVLKINEDCNSVGSAHELLVNKYEDVFKGLGSLPGELHLSVRDDAKPVVNPPRSVAFPIRKEVKQLLEGLEEKGVITKVTQPTDWVSHMLVTRKKSGKLRLCIDPADLNKSLKRAHYPMPKLSDVLPSLSKAKVFSVVDAKDGYWQIKLDEPSSLLTTFTTPWGRYRWLRCPMGISPAAEEYQRRQIEVLEGLDGVAVIADDILIYGCGETTEDAQGDHDRNLEAVFHRAREVNLKLNKSKLQLCKTAVPYMGHLLTSDGIIPHPNKVEAIAKMPSPDCPKAVQRMLGFIKYLSSFVPHLSDITQPLRPLQNISSDPHFSWQWTPRGGHTRSCQTPCYVVSMPEIL